MREETEKLFKEFVSQNPELVETNDEGMKVIRKSSAEMYELFMLYLSEAGNNKIAEIAEYIDSETDGEDTDDDDAASSTSGDGNQGAMEDFAPDTNNVGLTGETGDFDAMFAAACAQAGELNLG